MFFLKTNCMYEAFLPPAKKCSSSTAEHGLSGQQHQHGHPGQPGSTSPSMVKSRGGHGPLGGKESKRCKDGPKEARENYLPCWQCKENMEETKRAILSEAAEFLLEGYTSPGELGHKKCFAFFPSRRYRLTFASRKAASQIIPQPEFAQRVEAQLDGFPFQQISSAHGYFFTTIITV